MLPPQDPSSSWDDLLGMLPPTMDSGILQALKDMLHVLASSYLESESCVEIVGYLNFRTDKGLCKNILIDETVVLSSSDETYADGSKYTSCSFIEPEASRKVDLGKNEENTACCSQTMVSSGYQTYIINQDVPTASNQSVVVIPDCTNSEVDDLEAFNSEQMVVSVKVADEIWNSMIMQPNFLRLCRQFDAPVTPILPTYHRKKNGCTFKKTGVCSCEPYNERNRLNHSPENKKARLEQTSSLHRLDIHRRRHSYSRDDQRRHSYSRDDQRRHSYSRDDQRRHSHSRDDQRRHSYSRDDSSDRHRDRSQIRQKRDQNDKRPRRPDPYNEDLDNNQGRPNRLKHQQREIREHALRIQSDSGNRDKFRYKPNTALNIGCGRGISDKSVENETAKRMLSKRQFKTLNPVKMYEWRVRFNEQQKRLALNKASSASLPNAETPSIITACPEVTSLLGFSSFGGSKKPAN